MATLADLWARLRDGSGAGHSDGMSLLLRVAAKGVRLFAGLDVPSGMPAIVIELSKDARPKDLTKISTRTFDAQVVSLPGLSEGRVALSILLKAVEFEDLFSILGEDVVRAIETASGEADAVKSVVLRIERWRRFVERGRRRLSEEEVRGLLGELVVLSRCISHFGADAAIDAWQRDGGLRDFELPDFALEVKTYQAATGATVRIYDPAQLEPASNRPLYLTTLQLSRSETKGWTLGAAANEIVSVLAGNVAAIDRLWDRLADQGYLAQHAELYPERFLFDRVQLFHVDAGFPRIVGIAVPQGVEAVQFSIRLAAIQSFAVQAETMLGTAGTLESSS